MLDELQAEAADYEIDPLNYLLSVGQSLEEIEQYRKDGIPLWEVARAVHSIRERGECFRSRKRELNHGRTTSEPRETVEEQSKTGTGGEQVEAVVKR